MFSAQRLANRFLASVNCIHLRNIRQDLRSPVFASTYLFLLGIGTFAALLAAWAANESIREAGPVMFAALGLMLSLVLWLIQPLTTVRATVREREDATWELVQLSGIHPATIVKGLWLAGLQNALFAVAALAPFMCMAWLLRGLDLVTVIGTIAVTFLVACIGQAWAVLVGSLPLRKARRQSVNALFSICFGLLWGFSLAAWFSIPEWAPEIINGFQDNLFIASAMTVMFINLAGWLIILALVLATNQCKDAVEDQSSGPRLAWLLFFGNTILWSIFFGLATGLHPGSSITRGLSESIAVIAVLALIWSIVHAFFATTENASLTPRQARFITAWQQKGRLARGIAVLCGWFIRPGQRGGLRSSSVAFLVVPGLALLSVGLEALTQSSMGLSNKRIVMAVLYWQAYGVFLLALGTGLGYLLPPQIMTPWRRRAVALGVIVLLVFLLPIMLMMGGTAHDEAMSPLFHDDWSQINWIFSFNGGLFTLVIGAATWVFFTVRGWIMNRETIASLHAGPNQHENGAGNTNEHLSQEATTDNHIGSGKRN